jgi:hypothetical protein
MLHFIIFFGFGVPPASLSAAASGCSLYVGPARAGALCSLPSLTRLRHTIYAQVIHFFEQFLIFNFNFFTFSTNQFAKTY